MLTPFHSRIAPTPSGYLHLGNAFNFILTYLIVRRSGGTLRLRIDDLDQARFRPEYLADIFYSLEWLGIDYDLGPSGPEDHLKNYAQQHRLSLYQTLLEQLRAQAGVLYSCSHSRKQILAASTDGQYPLAFREAQLSLTLDRPNSAIRILTPETSDVQWEDLHLGHCTFSLYDQMRDFVVWRKEGYPAYQIASLADDLHYQTTGIVRGIDLLASTAAQLFLAQQVGAQTFAQIQFLHHPLLQDNDGNKLSKSAGALSLQQLRDTHNSPAFLMRAIAQSLHLRPTIETLSQLSEAYSAQKNAHVFLPKSFSFVDMDS